MKDELDALKRITEYIRQAREELRADLDAMDAADLARAVPGPRPDYVGDDLEGRN